ncbi:MAG TPA: hypothetical protein ENJ00_07120 [Phycisphaerales bacterium]|nr:hypothetical protein [Phycisphaerales bacterium]
MNEQTEHNQAPATQTPRPFVRNASYRVAHDLNGDWWIWKRSSTNTWTTFRRCNSQAEAELLCSELNAGSTLG